MSNYEVNRDPVNRYKFQKRMGLPIDSGIIGSGLDYSYVKNKPIGVKTFDPPGSSSIGGTRDPSYFYGGPGGPNKKRTPGPGGRDLNPYEADTLKQKEIAAKSMGYWTVYSIRERLERNKSLSKKDEIWSHPYWKNKGDFFYELCKYEEAAECYSKAIELQPNEKTTYSNMGAVQALLGRHEVAIKYLDISISLNPSNSIAWTNKGAILEDLGRHTKDINRHNEAILCLDEAIRLDPKYDKAWNSKGWALDGLGKYEEAIKCHDQALKLNPKNDNAWNNKGCALESLGKYEDAIKCYNKAIELNPKNDMAWNNKGWALDGLGKYEEAIKCYDQALALNPENDKARNNKSLTLKKLTSDHAA